MRIDKHGLYFILLSQLIWGFAPLIIRFVPPTLPTSLLIASRFVLGAIVIGSIVVLTKKTSQITSVPKKYVFQLMILGLLGSGMADFFFVEAIRRTGSVIATMVARTEIPLGVLFAGLILKEKLDSRIIVASFLSFCGIALISFANGGTVALKTGFEIGVACGIATAVIYALAGVYSKKIMNHKVSPYAVALYRNVFAGAFNISLAFLTLQHIPTYFTNLSPQGWLLLLYLGVFASAFGYITYYKGLEKIEAKRVSVLLSLSTVIALIVGIAAGESLTMFQWAGIAAIFVGIYLTVVPAPNRHRTQK